MVAGTTVQVVGTVGCLLVLANSCFGTPVLFMQACACVALSGWQVTRKSLGPMVYKKRVPRAGKELAGSPGYNSIELLSSWIGEVNFEPAVAPG